MIAPIHFSWLEARVSYLLLCPPVDRVSDYDGLDIELFILVGWGRIFLAVTWTTGIELVCWRPGISIDGQLTESVSPRF